MTGCSAVSGNDPSTSSGSVKKYGHLSNVEMLELLNAQAKEKSHSKDKTRPWVQTATLQYLKQTPVAQQKPSQARAFLLALKEAEGGRFYNELTKADKLQLINIQPKEEPTFLAVVEECETRFSDDDAEVIRTLIQTHFSAEGEGGSGGSGSRSGGGGGGGAPADAASDAPAATPGGSKGGAADEERGGDDDEEDEEPEEAGKTRADEEEPEEDELVQEDESAVTAGVDDDDEENHNADGDYDGSDAEEEGADEDGGGNSD